ncbi:TRAP transporter small permease [Anianabacter salinae]|uniref:TRAP transporter small permease n=1 Tax=Anianabacter salinae TaxID=2851023 RepID=UPI00225E6736|nr:TRAP transporter small permease [Anianabacter salinae]MBV0911518.1 TRAP transporter small permease [Anianabacter salinae]
MSGQSGYRARTKLGHWINEIEETVIALLLGLMTLVTFVNVVLRYGFNQSLIWGLEVTLILFAWLVLFGIAYGFKVTAHLGVDALINIIPSRPRRMLSLLAAAVCLVYALLLLKGAWDYWAPFAALQPTDGRWLPTGFAEGVRDRAFYTTDQVPMLGMFRWLEDLINYGDEYEKLPRVIPYAMLPFACAMIVFRLVEATIGLIKGERESLIVSHEAEDAVADAAALNKD